MNKKINLILLFVTITVLSNLGFSDQLEVSHYKAEILISKMISPKIYFAGLRINGVDYFYDGGITDLEEHSKLSIMGKNYPALFSIEGNEIFLVKINRDSVVLKIRIGQMSEENRAKLIEVADLDYNALKKPAKFIFYDDRFADQYPNGELNFTLPFDLDPTVDHIEFSERYGFPIPLRGGTGEWKNMKWSRARIQSLVIKFETGHKLTVERKIQQGRGNSGEYQDLRLGWDSYPKMRNSKFQLSIPLINPLLKAIKGACHSILEMK